MSEPTGRMIVWEDPSRTFSTDSTFDIEIRDKKRIEGEKGIVTNKIKLMELSDASWTIRVHESEGRTHFHADLHDIPEMMQKNMKKELFVTCDDKQLSLTPSEKYLGEFKICVYILPRVFAEYFVDNSIILSFRLVITWDGNRSSRHKFCDPKAARKAHFGNIAGMLGDPTFSDFTFIVGDREFKVHMCILAAASPVMRKMFTANLEEAKTKKCRIDAITSETFDHLLRFIYNCELPEDLKTIAKPLYEAAHYYEIEHLKEVCRQEIQESLSPDNAVEIFEWVQPYEELKKLKLDSWIIVKRDILKIFGILKNEPLPLDIVKDIIEHRNEEEKFWNKLKEMILDENENM